jgi:hypothetical protein
MSGASRLQCTCGRTRGYGEAGWRFDRDGRALCSTCHAARCRAKGSSLNPPTKPPVPLMASAPMLRSKDPSWKPPPEPRPSRPPPSQRPKPAPAPKPKWPPTKPPRSSGWKPSVTDRARRELLRDASRSNVQIAKQLRCTHGHVAKIRRAMIVAGELPAPGPTTYERVLEAVKADPAVNPSELAATLGVSRNTVFGAIHRARKQLRESGELQRERRSPD